MMRSGPFQSEAIVNLKPDFTGRVPLEAVVAALGELINGVRDGDVISDLYAWDIKLDELENIEPSELLTLEQADSIPWHPKHKSRGVAENGNYSRFTDDPVENLNGYWRGQSINAAGAGDIICQVRDFGNWKQTKKTKP